jgi:methionyl-tRNA formyltransferase
MGDAFTGNTTMLLEEGLDTGPILLQQASPSARADRGGSVRRAWPKAARRWWSRPWPAWPMEPSSPAAESRRSHLCPAAHREDGRMDFAARTATELKNRWRGFQPWPGAFTTLDGKKLIVHRMACREASSSLAAPSADPGQIHVESHRLFIACAGNTWLELVEVQLEGKKRLAAAEFLRGNALLGRRAAWGAAQ